jgi:D-sedoheptulose 7-phosphate isomerase
MGELLPAFARGPPAEKVKEHIEVITNLNIEKITQAADIITKALTNGKKLLLCGNGGSAADCQHVAGEFVNRFLFNHAPLPAIALTTDTSVLTAIGNDSDFDKIFSRQIQALGDTGDVLIAISTSGASKNILKAAKTAKQKNLTIIALTGEKGFSSIADLVIDVPSCSTPRIQEAHIFILHTICEIVEKNIFK